MHQPAPRTPPGNARQQKRKQYRLTFVGQPLKINILVQSALLSSNTSTTCKNQHTGTIRALIQQYIYNLQKSTYWYNPRPYPAIRLQPAKINILVQSAPLSSNTSTTCKNQHTGTIRALIQQYVYNLQKSTYWYNPRPYPAIRLQPAKINILVQSALIQQYVYNLQKSTYCYNPRPYPAIRLQPAKINILLQSAPLSSNTSTTCKNQHTGTIRALIQQYVYNLQKSTYWYNPRPYPAIRLQPAKINILVQSALLSSNISTTCKDQHTVQTLTSCTSQPDVCQCLVEQTPMESRLPIYHIRILPPPMHSLRFQFCVRKE